MYLANNATGFFGSIINILNFIITNASGLLIGLIVGGVAYLLLIGRLPKWLRVIIMIGCSIIGMFINSIFTAKDDTTVNMPSPEELEEVLSSTIIDGWKNTNGGFTFEQIITAQSDDECPSYEDQIIKMECQDYGDYVCFYYLNGNVYENAVFLKTERGLVYDGLLCATGDFETAFYGLFTKVFTDKWSWSFENTKIPYYYETGVGIGQAFGLGASHTYNDLVSVSSQKPTYMRWHHKNESGNGEVQSIALKQGAKLAGNNITDNFIKFGNVELIATKEQAPRAINTFYNYLYNNVKSKGYGNRAIIDTNNLTCLPIPEELQSNYPVSDKFKDKYPDKDYYGVYKCNIAFDLGYSKGNKVLTKNEKVEDYIEANDDKDSLKVDLIETKQELSQISIKFVDTGKSDLTNLDLLKNPIKIKFSSAELNESKILLINSKEMLTKANNVLLTKNAEWKFVIESNAVVIEDYIGTIKPVANKYDYSISYYYAHNHVLASVGLNPVGSVDTSLIDLANYPVKIQLKNDKNTYTFTFDSNDELNKYQSQMVEMGEYTYTILSSQLEFASESGSLEITNTDRTMLFNYILKEVEEGFKFFLDLESSTNSSSELVIAMGYQDEVLSQYYNDIFCGDYNLNLNIYENSTGNMVYSQTTLFQNKSSTYFLIANNENINANVRYLVQLSLISLDGKKVFTSEPMTCEFESSSYNEIFCKVY